VIAFAAFAVWLDFVDRRSRQATQPCRYALPFRTRAGFFGLGLARPELPAEVIISCADVASRLNGAIRREDRVCLSCLGLMLGLAIAWIQELGTIGDKLFAGAIAGGILAGSGVFFGIHAKKMGDFFPDWPLIFIIAILIAVAWSAI